MLALIPIEIGPLATSQAAISVEQKKIQQITFSTQQKLEELPRSNTSDIKLTIKLRRQTQFYLD